MEGEHKVNMTVTNSPKVFTLNIYLKRNFVLLIEVVCYTPSCSLLGWTWGESLSISMGALCGFDDSHKMQISDDSTFMRVQFPHSQTGPFCKFKSVSQHVKITLICKIKK